MKPFVKWAGGKRQILTKIYDFFDETDDFTKNKYIEPFLGGGAVFFDKAPQNAIINDLNSDLINAYNVIKSDKYEELINRLKKHSVKYFEDPDGYYYEIRTWDRHPKWPANKTPVERAARMIFLNKTCYNGLYRVNSKGQFNTPIGRYKNPLICDEENIREIHNFLSNEENKIEIMNSSYEFAINKASEGDIVYVDPPYDYEDDDGFTKYQMQGFTFEDFAELKKVCDLAIERGAIVIISNNATSKVINLFEQDSNYTIYHDVNRFSSLRSINCKANERKTGKEAIFLGIPNSVPFPQANDMEKIIALLMADEKVISDKEEAKKIINVTTSRQVAYYLSALEYFKYITKTKVFTKKALSIKQNENTIKEDIYNQLIGNKLFYKIYLMNKIDGKTNVREIKKILASENTNMSESTINRRASTIKSWIEWMYRFELIKASS